MRKFKQYFICKPNTPVTKELDRYYEDVKRNQKFILEMCKKIRIESKEVGITFFGDFLFIPTDKDLEKFKNKISKYRGGYYEFRKHTKQYKFLKREYKEKGISIPKAKLKDILNIQDDSEPLFGKADIDCNFIRYEDTYLLEIDYSIIESDYLEELLASDYYKILKKITKNNNKF